MTYKNEELDPHKAGRKQSFYDRSFNPSSLDDIHLSGAMEKMRSLNEALNPQTAAEIVSSHDFGDSLHLNIGSKRAPPRGDPEPKALSTIYELADALSGRKVLPEPEQQQVDSELAVEQTATASRRLNP